MRDDSSAVLENGAPKSIEDTHEEVDYLRLVKNAYESSTDYMSSNLRTQWERNYSNFLSRHPGGSKYRTEAYKHRSRLFRPKSRATERSKEAALVTAFFSTSDIVSISNSDSSDPFGAASARIWKEVINLRLRKTIPWFKIVIAAFQTAHVLGTVISYQFWDYQERIDKEDKEELVYDNETGDAKYETKSIDKVTIIKDEPCIELVENENFRIDPGASWVDPINTSPYTIHLIPMYIIDIMDRMEQTDSKTGQPRWKKLSKEQIYAYGSETLDSDTVRQAREGSRQDPKDDQFTELDEHRIVWVYRNIFKVPGKGDVVFYSLGSKHLLTEPKPLSEVYLHGMRPYTMGHTVIEAFRNYPSSVVELGQDMQAATNDNLNQRFDNVRQVLNKRYFVKRGSTVDLRSLRRNVSGSITMMNDPERDVKVHEPGDVTSSSYQEQNLFNADFDEITGNFSAGSVQTNKELGETVGGMRMLKDPSNLMTEYIIRTFAETWVKSTLEQILALERSYESDEVIIQAAGKNAKVDKTPHNLMRTALDLEINVGYGVTDPQARVTRLLFGMESINKLAPKLMSKAKDSEIALEIFGILGYDDGSRFFMNDEEYAKFEEENPPVPSEVDKQIESAEKMKLAQIEQDRLVWEERILSDERKKAADLKVQMQRDGEQRELTLGKEAIDIEKLNLDKLELKVKREDTLRKDAEIRDKEKATLNRSGGSNESKS